MENDDVVMEHIILYFCTVNYETWGPQKSFKLVAKDKVHIPKHCQIYLGDKMQKAA